MARDFNQFRNASAKLGRKTIDKLGTTFAIEYGLDGFNAVNNVVAPMPTDIKEYLEGDTSITIYACASNIDKLCEYALASFPNIEDLYLFKTSAIVVLEDDLSYLEDLEHIYVPSDLLSSYISAYPTLSSKFDTIVEDYTLTIPFIGDIELTSEYVDSVIAMLSSAEKNAITKVVIPTGFSEESANEIAWQYDFSELHNLNNNIWYGATQYDFSVLTIQGSGELTSDIVESSIASIPSNKLSGITKLVIGGTFTTREINCLSPTQEGGTKLINFTTLEILANLNISYISYLDSHIASGDSTINHIIVRNNTGTYINLQYNQNDVRNKTVKYVDLYNCSNSGGVFSQEIDALERIEFHEGCNTWFWLRNSTKLSPSQPDLVVIYPNSCATKLSSLNGNEKAYDGKLWLYFDTATITTTVPASMFKKLYVKAHLLEQYFALPQLLVNHTINDIIGFFTYDGTLPTYTNYTPTFYSDEDCSIVISQADMVVDTQYFVKLTAI